MEILHNTLELLDNMDISEGNRLILCNELKKLSNTEELMKAKKPREPRDKNLSRIYNNFKKYFIDYDFNLSEFKIYYYNYKVCFEAFERYILKTSNDDDLYYIKRIKHIFINYIYSYSINPIIEKIEESDNKIDIFIKHFLVSLILNKYIQTKIDIMGFYKRDYISYLYYYNKNRFLGLNPDLGTNI